MDQAVGSLGVCVVSPFVTMATSSVQFQLRLCDSFAIPLYGRLVNGVTGMKTPIPSGTESWVQRSPGVCGGEACIRNTRHTVSGLVVWRRSGLSDAQILKHHPDLTHADLTVAWSYYSQRAEEIDQAIKDDEES